jgi:hypothetical protein
MDQISNEQALGVIKEMIEKTKEKQDQTGFYHLLWGILISLAIVAMIILNEFELYNLIGYSWALFCFGGAITSVIYSKKTLRKQGVIKYPDLGLSSIWMSTMIAMFFVGFVFPFLNAYKWHVVFTMICLLMGVANVSMGILIKQKMSIINGILWWIGSVLFLIITNEVIFMGVFVLLLIVNNIIPGIILSKRARVQNGK